MATHHLHPRVTKLGRQLHLSYEFPHRIHCADVYPITAPNGSTLLLYGHERGLRVLWRGGRRRRRQPSQARTNGNHTDTIDLVSDEGDAAQDGQKQKEDEYEADEEEQDPDCPYPNIVEDLDIELGSTETPVAALHVAVPVLSPLMLSSEVLKKNAIVTIACSDGKVLLLRIPLALPSEEWKEDLLSELFDSVIELSNGGAIASDLAIKYLPSNQGIAVAQDDGDADGHLLVTSVSRVLSVWSVSVTSDFLISSKNSLLQKESLPGTATKLSFHPSARHAQLLVLDPTGIVRLYDPCAAIDSPQRPASSDSALANVAREQSSGKWIMAYHAPHHAAKESAHAASIITQRKKILDAKWALAGKLIVVLLEDGEWGIWDLYSTIANKRVEEFAIRGFLGTSSHTDAPEPSKQRGSSKLAPMTPNTRKSKAEQLFTGTPKTPGVAPRGGISVSSINSRNGQLDESVIIWYGSDIYSITSMQPFWQRSTSKDGGFGSLYSPGLSHTAGIKLQNENITTIAHFPIRPSSAGLGQMNTQRDIIVTAEHRAIVLQSTRPDGPSRQLFTKQLAARPAPQDQQMLDTGALDIDGMDRLLDSMAGNTTTRRVLFAAD